MEVKLDIGGDGRVKAMVMADKPETLDLLQKDSRGARTCPSKAGLKTDNNSLSFNLHGKEEMAMHIYRRMQRQTRMAKTTPSKKIKMMKP